MRVDLDSPISKAITTLKEAQKTLADPQMRRDFDQVIATLVGSRGDMYAPDLNKANADKETNEYLHELLHQEQGRNMGNSKVSLMSKGSGKSGGSGPRTAGAGRAPRVSLVLHEAFTSHSQLASSTKSEVNAMLTEQAHKWDFDVSQLVELTNGRPLSVLGMFAMEKFGILDRYHLDKEVVHTWLILMERNYHDDLPYHNATHAAGMC